MRIGARAEYAAKAVLYLSSCYPRVVTIGEIATQHRIPLKYLEQILLTLKKAGIVESRRGVHGGYTLGKPPRQISVAEVIRAIDQRFARSGCEALEADAAYHCPDQDICSLRALWLELQQAVERILETTTFADLCEHARDLQRRRHQSIRATVPPAVSASRRRQPP